ncbi:MAG TPA: POTRA domain-containing protein [Bdellovibrionota bacterium]|nr:POTRA domain-containing protein [Bdellovibrionota bacterium]
MRRLIWLFSWIAVLSLPAITASGARAADPAQGSRINVEIDRIEITGVTVFPAGEIEEALEIGIGDRLERIKVVRTAESIQGLYRMHGYEQVAISSRLIRRKGDRDRVENVLEISIQEGDPTRIGELTFAQEGQKSAAFQKYWSKLESSLRARAAIPPGTVFDQEKISASKRILQETFASEEFVGARVDDVRVQTIGAPAAIAASLPAGSKTARWVRLEFRIDLGDRVSFGFRGHKAFSTGRLHALVDEQRLLGLGKDYIGVIRQRIEDAYREEGYANIRVLAYSFERSSANERHVTYAIEEGPRVTIDSIEFDGNQVFSSEELRERFFDFASPLVQKEYYVEKEVQHSAELLVEWIKSKGYLSAKLITINTINVERKRATGGRRAVRLIVYLYEGDQTLVHSVRLKGLQAISADEARGILGVKENEPLNLFAFSQGVEGVKAAYRAKGYLGVRILNENSNTVVTYSQDNRSADIELNIDEGPQFKATRIEIEGLSQTKEFVIRRELEFKVGDVLEEGRLIESEANLRRLGIFSSVAVRVLEDPENPSGKIVRVSIQEGTPGLIAGGPGFRNDLGIRAFGEISYTNLWGRNHTLSLGTRVNRRLQKYRFTEYSAQLAYLWPWFGIDELSFRPALTASGVQYENFDAQAISLTLTWERRLLRRPNLTASLTYNLENVRQFNSTDDTCIDNNPATICIDNQTLRIGSLTPSLRLDLRDNPLAPTSGLFVSVSDEIAQPWMLSQTAPTAVAFNRFLFRADYLWPVLRDVTWFFSIRSGLVYNLTNPAFDANGNETSFDFRGFIPLVRQFALGGANSLRGYREQELNTQRTVIQGFASFVNYRTQLDLPFSGALRFGPFLDAANLNVDRFSFGDLKFGAGFGFHYQTPVGPVNLDWGFKLKPEPGTDTNQVYFSIGVI